MSFTHSPLRYPGGKGRISDYFSRIIRDNDLVGGEYIEPYAGGAGVALSLLFKGDVSHIHINDLNYPIYCFWHSALFDTENLCRKISNCTISVSAWKRHKNKLAKNENYSILDVGFAFLFLNRTNRSGIISGGMIGGYDQKGNYKMDCRFNKSALIKKIVRIGESKTKISLYNMDAQEFLIDVVSNVSRKSLTYIDPPYYMKGQRLYDNFYNPEDHTDLAQSIKSLDRNWVVSYDNVNEVRNNFLEHRMLEYSLNYSAAKKYSGSELMVYSDQLVLPLPNSPVPIKKAS